MNKIEKARKVMWEAFEADPDLAETYMAQIVCFIMDNFKGYKRNKTKRDKLARILFEILYKE